MIIKTQKIVKTESEIEITEPVFYKNKISDSITSYLGVIEECTIKLWVFPGRRTSIENNATEDAGREISEAYNSWEHISEEEFFEALDKALKDFNFKPSLVTTSQLMEGEDDRRGAIGNW